MLISPAYAQAAGAAGAPSAMAQLFPFLLIMVIFYFFMIRPQQKRYKEHKAMLEAITKGDKIVTSGGIVGKVVKVADDMLDVEIAESTTVKVLRSTVSNVLESKAKKAEAAKKDAETTSKKVADKKKVANDN